MAGLPFTGEERRDGVVALSYTLGQMAALFLMCDRHDLGVALGDNGQGEAVVERGLARLRPPSMAERGGSLSPPPGNDYEPNVFVYDNYPGGIGLSEPLYRLHGRLLAQSLSLISSCPCHEGCPSCVGPVGEVGSRGKEVALALLRAILA
jgi:DEAD/DEAH box helicase domain-containing protein